MLFFGLFFSFSFPVFAANNVVINEFLANPSSDQGEWVELYNPTANDVSLVGWKLIDASGSTKALDNLGIILSGGFVVYEYSGDGWLNNTSADSIQMKDNNGVIVDTYSYSDDQEENITTGRTLDGTGNFTILASVTKGSANSPALPTVTLTPTEVPTPTKTPTPTRTPTPTPTIKPTATPKITQVPTSTLVPTTKVVAPTIPKMATQDNFEEEKDNAPTSILGEMVTATPSAMPTEVEQEKAEESFFNFPKLAIGLGFIFLAGSGILAFRSYKKSKEDDYR